MADTIPITGTGGSLPCGVPPNGLQPYHATPRDWVENMPDKVTLTEEQKAKWSGMIGATKLYLHEMRDVSLIDNSPTAKTPEEMVKALEGKKSFARRYGNSYGMEIISASTRLTSSYPTRITIHFYNDIINNFETCEIDLAGQTDTVTAL
jgi:hypothetical protein